jgi:hypothetical protein
LEASRRGASPVSPGAADARDRVHHRECEARLHRELLTLMTARSIAARKNHESPTLPSVSNGRIRRSARLVGLQPAPRTLPSRRRLFRKRTLTLDARDNRDSQPYLSRLHRRHAPAGDWGAHILSGNYSMRMTARLRAWFLALCVCGFSQVVVSDLAAAQWTRVLDLPASDVFSVWANGDTIVAGLDSTIYVSTDGGTSWLPSTKPAQGVRAITALRVRNHRLYAGAFGQGVFVSDDLGATWQDFNQGLVGGFGNFQLLVNDFEVLDDRLIAATLGAGVYARDLDSGAWAPFGDAFEANQGMDVLGLALGGTRLTAQPGKAPRRFPTCSSSSLRSVETRCSRPVRTGCGAAPPWSRQWTAARAPTRSASPWLGPSHSRTEPGCGSNWSSPVLPRSGSWTSLDGRPESRSMDGGLPVHTRSHSTPDVCARGSTPRS